MKNLNYFSVYLFLGLILTNMFALFNVKLFYLAPAFTVSYVLLAPGFLLLSFLVKRKVPLFLGVSLSVALSVFTLMILGLAVNIILPFFGIAKPLTTLYLLMAFTIFIITLLCVTIIFEKENPMKIPSFNGLSWLVSIFGILLPILICFGSISLNNGGSNILTMIALVLVGVLVLTLVLANKYLDEEVSPLALYMMALSFLLMNSMRGWFITGHDILLEYHVFELTNASHLWNMAVYPDPYNACLSITILPTYLQNLTHIPDAYIYKIVTQFISALSLPLIFYLSKYYTSTRTAFLTGFLYVSFPTFMTDMAMLNRQGIAFLFVFALVYILLTEHYFDKRIREVLLYVLGIGMILSHYSTSYVTIGLLIGGYFINKLLRFIMSLRRPLFLKKVTDKIGNREMYERPVLLTSSFVLSLVIFAVIWSAGVTKTSKSITNTLRNIAVSVVHPFEDDGKDGVTKYSLIQSKQPTTQELFDSYVQNSVKEARTPQNESNFYDLKVAETYPITAFSEPTSPLTSLGEKIQSILPVTFSFVYDGVKQLYAKLLQILLIIGLTALAFGYGFKKQITVNVPVEYIALSISALMLIVIQTVLPSGAINYGLLRLFQQNLVILALPISLGGLFVISLVTRSRRTPFVLYGMILSAFFLVLSGFIPQVTGGGRSLLPLSNSGLYYDVYYTHREEFEALNWLSSTFGRKYPVESDRYFSSMKMLAYANTFPITIILPETIRRDSLVYLNYKNATTDNVTEYVNGDVVYYKFPINFLDDNKDLIYNNGGSKFYR